MSPGLTVVYRSCLADFDASIHEEGDVAHLTNNTLMSGIGHYEQPRIKGIKFQVGISAVRPALQRLSTKIHESIAVGTAACTTPARKQSCGKECVCAQNLFGQDLG